MKRLRFALLHDGTPLYRWHHRCLDELAEVADLAGVTVVPAEPRAGAPRSAAMRRYAERMRSRSSVDVGDRFAAVPRVAPGSAAFDFVLSLGVSSLPDVGGDIWFFAHETDPDFLPFFREVYEGDDVTYAALLSSRDEVLEEGWFRTDLRSDEANRNRVEQVIADWPARVCRRLLAGAGRGVAAAPRRPSPRRLLEPRVLPFVSATLRSRIDVAWERLFRHPQWNVGVIGRPVGTLLSAGEDLDRQIEWLPLEDRDGFFADPFGVARDGRLQILCEYFGYREGRGRICTLDYSSGRFTKDLEPAIDLPLHMSYPFLLERAGELYCVPETSGANEVAAFLSTDFPRGWSKAAVLVERFAGLDPTVFEHEGRWWLMCTEKGPREDVELWIWHAADLLGPWEPHARNPVKSDVRGVRPGGPPFVHDGVLYRPAQDCSRTYGWRLAIQRVNTLTPVEFDEEEASIIEASPHSPFPRGRHTLSPVGDVVLVDGRRDVFVWAAFRAFLGIWARDLARKASRG
jgi:hypothetical protein